MSVSANSLPVDTSNATALSVPPASTTQSTTSNAKYTALDDEIIVDTLVDKRGTFQTDSGWRPAVWNLVLVEVVARGSNIGGPKNGDKVKDHYGTDLKKGYITVKELRALSGFGWDEINFQVTATSEVWNAFLADKANKKKYGKFRNKPFPLYDRLAILIDGIYATGENAITGGNGAGGTNPPSAAPSTAGLSRSASAPDVLGDNDDSSDPDTPTTPTLKRKTPDNPLADTPLFQGAQASISIKRSHSSTRERSTPQSRSVEQVANALSSLTNALTNLDGEPTPKRRKRAIQLFEEDDDFPVEKSSAVYTFFRDVNNADTFTSIGSRDKRTNWLHSVVE